MSLTIQPVREARRFVALGPLWSQLATDSGRTSPFLSHDWFWCCWHAVWPGRRPEILLVEDAGRPVAVIPLMTWTEWVHAFPVRCLGFLEVPHAPHVDILSVADLNDVVAAFLEHLRTRAGWDVLRLGKLPATSPTLLVLRNALARGPFAWRASAKVFPYLTLRGRAASDPASSRAASDGLIAPGGRETVSVEEHREVDAAGALFQEALALTRRSCAACPPSSEPRMPQFLGQVMRRGSRCGWFSLWVLKLGTRLVAVEYQVRAEDGVYGLATLGGGVPPGFAATDTLRAQIFDALGRSGAGDYHVRSTGNDPPHTSIEHNAIELTLFRSRLYSRLLHGVGAAVTPLLRAWREITLPTSRAAARK